MGHILGTEWEMPIVLAGMYGLRMSEILGLHWNNVDLNKREFAVMAPVKGKEEDGSGERSLPITDEALPYFLRQLALQERQKEMAALSGSRYYDNCLVVAKPNGIPSGATGCRPISAR